MHCLRVGTALLVLTTVACRDNPSGPAGSDLTVEILQAGVPFEEETLAPGTTLQLNVTPWTGAGVAQDDGALDWSSTDASVATVDGSGRVTAVQVGTTLIIVSTGEHADTGRVNVATAVAGSLECSAAHPGLSMPVGEVRVLAGTESVELCLPGGATGADFVLVPFNASVAAAARLETRLVASFSTPAGVGPAKALSTRTAAFARGVVSNERFHELHLQRSRAALASRLSAGQAAFQVGGRAASAPGELMQLNAAALSRTPCLDSDYRTGRVVAVSDRAVVVADTTNPQNGFSQEDYLAIAEKFDDLIWPVNSQNFGDPSDIDANDRVILFFTRAVNELTPPEADSYVGGFFYNRDLFPKSGASACAGSNEAEMFYLLVPDSNGEVNGNVIEKELVLSRTAAVLAHEFQHLINDSRRLYITKAPEWEDAWLNEGLSHIAEELAFYAASGHTPGENLGSTSIEGESARAFDQYNLENVIRYIYYLGWPEESSPMGEVERLETRGAAWAFLRYIADREPGDDAAMWRRLVDSPTSGLKNLEAVLGVDPRAWMHDWHISVFADDAGVAVAPEFTQPSWNFRALTPLLDPSGMFPLRVTGLGPDSPGLSLQGGGAAYFQVGVGSGGERAVRMTVEGLPPPSRMKLGVVRMR